jgi:hypothetical protein
MGWDLLTAICTLLGGIAAAISVYSFIEEIVSHVRSRSKRLPPPSAPVISLPPAIPVDFAAGYQDYIDFYRQMDHHFGSGLWGKMVVYTRASRLNQEAHVHERARWVRYHIAPGKHVQVKCYRNMVNGHALYAAVFDLPPDDYQVWIGKSRRRPFFKKTASAPVFSGKVTELYIP